MTLETGSYTAPAGKLGDQADQSWSSTTIGASVDGKPNPGGMVVTRVGEIVDFSCYPQVGKHGGKHRDCAQKCMRNGQPSGLLTQDGTLYMLMEEDHDPRPDGMTNFRQAPIDHTAHIMEATGTRVVAERLSRAVRPRVCQEVIGSGLTARSAAFLDNGLLPSAAIKWGFQAKEAA